MGAYLSTPVTDKESEGGGDARFSYGVCAMQGWRTDMEDAHIVNLDVDDTKKGQVALFGVFDGHGGKEVAKFCAKHIAEALTATDEYKQGNYGEALRRTYLDMDVIMKREEHMAELEAYRKGSDDEEGAPDGSLKKVWFIEERFIEERTARALALALARALTHSRPPIRPLKHPSGRNDAGQRAAARGLPGSLWHHQGQRLRV